MGYTAPAELAEQSLDIEIQKELGATPQACISYK